MFGVFVGGAVGISFLFTFVLQPIVVQDVESAALRNGDHRQQQAGLQRGASALSDGEGGDVRHSPLMLLRERETARRKIASAASKDRRRDAEAEDERPKREEQQLADDGSDEARVQDADEEEEQEDEDGDDEDEGGDGDEEDEDSDEDEDEEEEEEEEQEEGEGNSEDDEEVAEVIDADEEEEDEDGDDSVQVADEEDEDEDEEEEEGVGGPKYISKLKDQLTLAKQQRDQVLKAQQGLDEDEDVPLQDAAEIDGIRKNRYVGEKPKKRITTLAEQEQSPKKARILPRVERNARAAPVEGDPLRAADFPFERKGIDVKPAVEFLGTLLDAGRHYFPIEWIKKLIDRLSDMNYNLIHFRLTDDQTFNVLLKSRPDLAYPSGVDNPGKAVYSVDELKDLTAYAKERGIRIMPEVNVPGHAGAWAGIPDMIVHCPNFICQRGYGIPLNVTHHALDAILTDIIKELVEIFDDPPFIHLGGDEVNMADPCFKEVGVKPFDYPAFEQQLKKIIKASGYPEDRIVRWEMTGQKSLDRAGAIEQFWESHPGDRHDANGKFFVSTWMYFDTNTDQGAYEVFTKASKNFHLKEGKVPTAIIAGTFELSCEFWYDRNVLGRLLSVAIGASNPKYPEAQAQNLVRKDWKKYCEQLGFGEIICDTDGGPVIATRIYHNKWRKGWEVWKKDICGRLTETKGVREYKLNPKSVGAYTQLGSEYFWKNFPLEISNREDSRDTQVDVDNSLSSELARDVQHLRKHLVPHTGVILDAASAMPQINRLHTIINDYVSVLGFNLAQLRLVNNYGFVYQSDVQANLGHSLIAGKDNPLYSLKPELEKLVDSAKQVGVDMMPEVSVSTDAGGWYRSGLLANCPDFYCTGKGTPNDINKENLMPVLYSVIGELRQIFTSRFFHLGTDERQASMGCFEEAKIKPDFEKFERKLQIIMAMADLPPKDILRAENKESVHYPSRTGAITQYSTGQLEGIRNEDEGSLFFLTVDIFDGDGYDIFENAKKAVALKPLGIMAELRKLNDSKWKSWSVPKRLLAFAMGVSEIGSSWSIYNAESFASHFVTVCQALQLQDADTGDCSPPDRFSESITVITEGQAFREKSCEVRTRIQDRRVAKKVSPFYRDQVAAEK